MSEERKKAQIKLQPRFLSVPVFQFRFLARPSHVMQACDLIFSSFSFAVRFGNEADETDSSGEEEGEEGTTRSAVFFSLFLNLSRHNTVTAN